MTTRPFAKLRIEGPNVTSLQKLGSLKEFSGAELGASLSFYVLTYIALFVAYMIVLTHLAGKGAESVKSQPTAVGLALSKGGD